MQEATQDSFQVSPQQEELWLAEPEGPSARLQLRVRLTGPLEESELEVALRRIVDRHESLRTTFARQPGIRVPLQVVNPELHPSWRAADLRAIDEPARAARLDELVGEELEARIDFAAGPLVRALLVTLDDERRVLVLTLSALCADLSSVGSLMRELVHSCGGDGEIVEAPLQYADFSQWQRDLMDSDDGDAQEARGFWARFDSAVGPSIPFARDGSSAFVPEELTIELGPDSAELVKAGAAQAGVTVPAFVHAAWSAVLGRVTGESPIVTAFLGLERRHRDLEGAIGAYARPVPTPVELDGQTQFATLLAKLGQALAEAGRRLDYAPGDFSGMTVGFVAYPLDSGRAGTLELSLDRVVMTGRHPPLGLACESDDRGLRLGLRFDPESHALESIQRLAGELERLLLSAATDPTRAIGELELLDSGERARLLSEWGAAEAPVPSAAVHELIATRAAASPDRSAVIDQRAAMTYAELDARANQVAHRLRAAGVGPDVTVGLCTDRSVEMIVGLLGIIKAGGAYLPLHYELPPARLSHQLTAVSAGVVLTQERVRDRLPEFGGETILLDGEAGRAALEAEPTTAPAVTVSAENLVYVIYTSGSTGAPKGVGVTHGNLANYATDIARRLGADAEPMSFGLVTSISTDLGNTSVFGALCSGGTLVLVSPDAAADPAALAAQLERTPIDVLKITPSHIGALLSGGDPGVLPRRCLIIGGERAPWDLVAKVQTLADCEILNHYGPTEATVGCCAMRVPASPGPLRPATVPIGRPLGNARCYVLDDREELVPVGTPGRLLIGGAGVASGYLGEPEMTAERFLPDPFSPAPGARMYDTGDLARWLLDGTLEFLGRSDEQVKIRGYRVEPAEVETALRSHPQVNDAVVVTRTDPVGGARLIGYCVVDGTVGEEELQRHLAQWLPEYMLPAAIVTLDELPRTPSGKVDRLSLPEPADRVESSGEYTPPRTPIEQAVAAMWSEALGVERIGVTDDFFALGGHSLLATQVVAQVRSDFAVELPLSSLFTSPTIETLAAEIAGMMGEYEGDETARLVAELEGLSDDEVERLLAGEEASER